MTIYNGVKILDKYLRNKTVSEIFNVGEKSQDEIVRRIVLWARDNEAKTVSVLRIRNERQIQESAIDGIININFGDNGILKIGILKVYGNVDFDEVPSFVNF